MSRLLLICWMVMCGGASLCAAQAEWRDTFVKGEHLTFKVVWGIFWAATLETEVLRETTTSGELRLQTRLKSEGFVDAVYPIRSKVESRVNPDDLGSVSFYEDRNEGSHRYHRLTEFDLHRKRVIWANFKTGRVYDDIPFPEPATDIFTALFRARAMDWKAGQERKLRIFSDAKYATVTVRAEKSRRLQVGTWAQMKVLDLVSPDLYEAAMKRRGSLRATVTDDARHLPLLARLEMSWGTVRLDLVSATGIVGQPLAIEGDKP